MKFNAGIITVSDRGFSGEREDKSGPALKDFLEKAGFDIAYTEVIPDEADVIEDRLIHASDVLDLPLILTTGGTGFSLRDVTPEATKAVIDREVPGIPEVMRAKSMEITPKACLSRSVAGMRGRSLIVNLPGSPKAAVENLEPVIGSIIHGLELLRDEGPHDCSPQVQSV